MIDIQEWGMKTLWFKGCYVNPILSGEKIDTIRRESSRLPKKGDDVAFSVGPRPPFAKAKITDVTAAAFMSEGRKRELKAIYGSAERLIRIEFKLL